WFERFGFRRDEEPDGEEARQRHASLVTLLGIAERLAGPGSGGPEAGHRPAPPQADQADQADPAAGAMAGMALFLEEVGRRAAQEAEGTGGGVNLLTYHRAKGLGFEAGLLPAIGGGGV